MFLDCKITQIAIDEVILSLILYCFNLMLLKEVDF